MFHGANQGKSTAMPTTPAMGRPEQYGVPDPQVSPNIIAGRAKAESLTIDDRSMVEWCYEIGLFD